MSTFSRPTVGLCTCEFYYWNCFRPSVILCLMECLIQICLLIWILLCCLILILSWICWFLLIVTLLLGLRLVLMLRSCSSCIRTTLHYVVFLISSFSLAQARTILFLCPLFLQSLQSSNLNFMQIIFLL